MPLLLKSGGVFLHIPKTGGNFITRVLQEQNLVVREFGHKHADFDRVMHREGFEYASPDLKTVLGHWWRHKRSHVQHQQDFLFCFVRHPLRWYESWFRYCKSFRWRNWGEIGNKYDWHPNAILNGTGDNDFNTFIRNAIARRPGYVSELFFSFAKPGIDFVGRQEDLRDDLIRVLRQLNENFDEDHIRSRAALNLSKTPESEVQWDPKLRETVTRLELPALARFGYLSDAERQSLGLPDASGPSAAVDQRAGRAA